VSDQRASTEETVAIPISFLRDLAYHLDKTSQMQAIPTAVVTNLVSRLPDPDEELRNRVRNLVANPEISDSRINAIIQSVRENS
jgi:hypothetical protein